MYTDYWQLDAKPFQDTASDEAYFACESHEGSLLKLRYAVEQHRPAAVLAGPSGVGKTLLVHKLSKLIQPVVGQASRIPVVHLVFPQMSGRELLCYLAERLNAPQVNHPTGAIEESVRRLEDLAIENSKQGIYPLVVIDEAHLLEDTGAFETLRLLTNFQVNQTAAMSLLLVGQMGLLSSIARWPTLDERLAVKTLVRSFTASETSAYLDQQLRVAGSTRTIFTDEAVEQLHVNTAGVARRINRLADLALVVGMAEQLPSIGAEQINAIERELITVGNAA